MSTPPWQGSSRGGLGCELLTAVGVGCVFLILLVVAIYSIQLLTMTMTRTPVCS